MCKLTRKEIVLCLVVASCFACTPSATTSPDEQEIHLTREVSNKALAAHDTASLASTMTVDYHVVTSRNVESSGRASMVARLGADMKAKPDLVYVRTPTAIQVFPEWKMASESGTWTGRWTEGVDKIELTGTYYAKWHKIDGKWIIRAEIFTALNCSGGGYCDQTAKMW